MIKSNRFKKFFLFLNATSFKLANTGRYKDGVYNNNLPLALLLIFCLEFSIFRLLSIIDPHIQLPHISVFFPTSFIIHLSIYVIFKSDFDLIEKDYEQYYLRYYYVLYCIVIIPSVIYTITYLFRFLVYGKC